MSDRCSLTAAAVAILPFIEVNYANAQTIQDGDARLFTEHVTYAGQGSEMKAYVARPKEMKKYPTVMVIHENRGLNPHIEDVTRRMALEGLRMERMERVSNHDGIHKHSNSES